MAYESDVAIVLRREDFIKLRKAYLKFHEDHPKTSWDEARVFGTPHAEIHEAETDDGPKVVIHWKRIEWYQGEFGSTSSWPGFGPVSFTSSIAWAKRQTTRIMKTGAVTAAWSNPNTDSASTSSFF